MPSIFHHDCFRLFFYSNEDHPREPAQIHIMGDGGEAKFWHRPEVIVADCLDVDAKTLRRLASVVEAQRDMIERAWHDHFA